MPPCLLIVDDSEADQFLTEYAIKRFDPSIITYKVYDGIEAIEFIESQEHTVDKILLDINMPRMDGIEFLQAYADLPNKQSSAIFMLTSSIREDDYKQCMAYPFVHECLSKPLSKEMLSCIFNAETE